MLTPLELKERHLKAKAEMQVLEKRIEEASFSVEEDIWAPDGIISPFERNHKISKQTEAWLTSNGWKLTNGRIIAIFEAERYIP